MIAKARAQSDWLKNELLPLVTDQTIADIIAYDEKRDEVKAEMAQQDPRSPASRAEPRTQGGYSNSDITKHNQGPRQPGH